MSWRGQATQIVWWIGPAVGRAFACGDAWGSSRWTNQVLGSLYHRGNQVVDTWRPGGGLSQRRPGGAGEGPDGAVGKAAPRLRDLGPVLVDGKRTKSETFEPNPDSKYNAERLLLVGARPSCPRWEGAGLAGVVGRAAPRLPAAHAPRTRPPPARASDASPPCDCGALGRLVHRGGLNGWREQRGRVRRASGGREGRDSRRLGCLGRRSSPGTWLFPKSLPLRAPLAPCFHPPESLRMQNRRAGPQPPAAPARATMLALAAALALAAVSGAAAQASPAPARARPRARHRPRAVGGAPTAVGGARRAPAAAANGRDERRGGLLSSPRGGGRAAPRAPAPALSPAPVEVARRHQRTSTDRPHGPVALRLRRPALCSRGRLSRTSPVRAAPTPRAAPRARPVVDRGPAQRASGGSRNPNNAGTGAGHGGRAGGAGLRHHAGPPLPATPVVPPDIVDAQT